MSDWRKAAQAALEALEYMHAEKVDYMIRNKLGDPTKETAARLAVPAMAALRAALAKPDQPLTESDIRRIVREELERMNVVKDKDYE